MTALIPDTPISSIETLQRMLSTGELFSFDVNPSASRAYLHSIADSPTAPLKAILHTNISDSSGSAMALQLGKFRVVLNSINQQLVTPLHIGNIPKCVTLLDQLIQEEQLIQAYVLQIVENKSGTRPLRIAPSQMYSMLSRRTPNEQIRYLTRFFNWLPQYATPEQHAHMAVLKTGDQNTIDQFEIRDIPHKSYLTCVADGDTVPLLSFIIMLFCIQGALGLGTAALIGEKFLMAQSLWQIPLTLIMVMPLSGLRSQWYDLLESVRLSASRHLTPLINQFCSSVGSWDRITHPKSFEEKWFLRAYFALMHSASLNSLSKLKSQQLMTFHHLDVDDFAFLVYYSAELSIHDTPTDQNPYFYYAN